MVAVALGWSNHFGAPFHGDDLHTIVNNKAIQSFGNIPRFFVNPKTFSALREYASWRPLLSTSFALDYWASGGSSAQLFLIHTFIWFLVLLAFVYGLFRLIPGGSHFSALFGTAIVAVHPITADTINYISQRGAVFGALGIVMGLSGWIVWPRLLPKRFDLKAPGVPKTDWDAFRKRTQPRLDAAWTKFSNAPLGLYLFPVVVALFASPQTASFALILLAYVIVLDSGRKPRDMVAAAAVCGALWVIPMAFTWRAGTQIRQPVLAYWAAQPLAVVRYFLTFVDPTRLSIDSSLERLGWLPVLAGLAGLAGIVFIALLAGKRDPWRPVAFGLWWFLLALVPDAILPQRDLEAAPRLFIAMIGLALALTRSGGLLLDRARSLEKWKLQATIGAIAGGSILIAGLTWQTSARNVTWDSEETIWFDATQKNPGSGRVLQKYAEALLNGGANPASAYELMKKAAGLSPESAQIQVAMADLASSIGRVEDSETHYKAAIAVRPDWAGGYAYYAQWLLSHQRVPAAIESANKALAIQSDQLVARHVLMDIQVVGHEWDNAAKLAQETLGIAPDDADAFRALNVATMAKNELKEEEANAAASGRDGYLALSVTYFKNNRYDDCIRAARKALTLDPNLAEAWANISAAYHSMGKIDEAIEASKEAVRLKPDLPYAKNNLEYELAEQAELRKRKEAGSSQ